MSPPEKTLIEMDRMGVPELSKIKNQSRRLSCGEFVHARSLDRATRCQHAERAVVGACENVNRLTVLVAAEKTVKKSRIDTIGPVGSL